MVATMRTQRISEAAEEHFQALMPCRVRLRLELYDTTVQRYQSARGIAFAKAIVANSREARRLIRAIDRVIARTEEWQDPPGGASLRS
jgi:hypothetical protein